MSVVGDNIRRNRLKCGMSQKILADLLGVSPKTVSKWETNMGLPDVLQIVPLARALGISVDELMCFEEESLYQNYPYGVWTVSMSEFLMDVMIDDGMQIVCWNLGNLANRTNGKNWCITVEYAGENGIEKTEIECHSRIGASGPYKAIVRISMERSAD